MEQFGLPKYSPRYLMADGSKAISKAGKTFLPGAKRIQCWKHVKDALFRYKGKLPCPKIDWPIAINQVRILQRAPTQAVFNVASAMLLTEWRENDWTAFAKHFEDNCLGRHANW